MAESKKRDLQEEQPHGHRDRGVVSEGPHKGKAARPRPSHDPENDRITTDETFQPDREGPES